ncbi:MAG: hypothetical protein GKR94_04955 [Gammaproteobacteria bacterium]|nr:hypothetical protein [Gammaproteobacteria bacterium]
MLEQSIPRLVKRIAIYFCRGSIVSQADDIFYRQFGAVLVLLAIFGVSVYFIAAAVGDASHARIVSSEKEILKRIAPVGTVEVEPVEQQARVAPAEDENAAGSGKAADELAAAAVEQPAKEPAKAESAEVASTESVHDESTSTELAPDESVAVAATGEAVYDSSCKACHAAGLLNAPKPTDTQAWSARAKAGGGIEGLYNSAINGMPPNMAAKGGNLSLSDEEVKAAVRFMLKQAGVDAG